MTKEEMIALVEELELSEDVKDAAGLLQALKTANAEAKNHREALEEAQEKITSMETFKGASKTTAIERELKAAGVKNPDRIAKLMKIDSIELDESGQLQGFDEQFEIVKTDYSELFDAKKRAANVEQFEKETAKPELTATQLQLAAVRASQGR